MSRIIKFVFIGLLTSLVYAWYTDPSSKDVQAVLGLLVLLSGIGVFIDYLNSKL